MALVHTLRRYHFLVAAALTFLLFTCIVPSFGADPSSGTTKSGSKRGTRTAPTQKKPVIGADPRVGTTNEAKVRHFVALKFKDAIGAAQRKSTLDAFKALKDKIPRIESLESGGNISTEKLNKGLTEAFLLTFKSDKDRDAYLTHPAHVQFKKTAMPVVADIVIIDYWSKP